METEEGKVLAPLKVAFRAEALYVVAYVSATDGSFRNEIGRIMRRVCDEDKTIWHEWMGVMRKVGFHIIESIVGVKIESYEEIMPEMLEGGGPEA